MRLAGARGIARPFSLCWAPVLLRHGPTFGGPKPALSPLRGPAIMLGSPSLPAGHFYPFSSASRPPMRFSLLDRITSCEPGVRLTAVKNVSLSEEYLADHFPAFPVLPGVFMLEAMVQAGACLIRITDDYAHSLVTLRAARGVKYADFVPPGSSLQVTVEMVKQEDALVHLKGRGEIDGRSKVSGRLVLHRRNLADEDARHSALDSMLIRHFKSMQAMLFQDETALSVTT